MQLVLNPTGQGIRNDDQGGGNFGDKRGARFHVGVDFTCIPGQTILSPISGRLVREKKPYPGEYSGILIESELFECTLFYLTPMVGDGEYLKWGKNTLKGDPLGVAQDISKKYPGMTPHVHLQLLFKPFNLIHQNALRYVQDQLYVDPLHFMDLDR